MDSGLVGFSKQYKETSPTQQTEFCEQTMSNLVSSCFQRMPVLQKMLFLEERNLFVLYEKNLPNLIVTFAEKVSRGRDYFL